MTEMREAVAHDAPGIASLLVQLDYEVSTDSVQNYLAARGHSNADPVLVVVEDVDVLGVIALHWTWMLHRLNPVARITTLVVSHDQRGRGLGRLLVNKASELAQNAGCDIIELTTALDRQHAQGFYKALGFIASSLRFHRSLI